VAGDPLTKGPGDSAGGPEPLFESTIPELDRLARGKVRDLYRIDEAHLLIVTTDRVSAFDAVLPNPIPGKGRYLTRISDDWFARLAGRVRDHRVARPLETVITDATVRDTLAGRVTVVRWLDPLPVEAVVRGYLAGSAWSAYAASGSVYDHVLPPGLRLGERLPEPIFTPTTKAEVGAHDAPLTRAELASQLGAPLAEALETTSLDLYQRAAARARERGLLLADSKLEFAVDDDGALVVIDELFTPDSSRYWRASDYAPGAVPPSYDKQPIRDYLRASGWAGQGAPPVLPATVVEQVQGRYLQLTEWLLGDGSGGSDPLGCVPA